MLRVLSGHLRPADQPEQPRPAPAAAADQSDQLALPPLSHHLPANDPEGADAPGTLSPGEVEFFKTNGYLIKRKLIPAEVLAPFVDE